MNFRLLYSVPQDYSQRWERWTRLFRGRGSTKHVKALRVADTVLVVLFVLIYLLLVWGYLLHSFGACFVLILRTALCFCVVSLLRSRLNRQRPYERFDIKPLIPKSKLESGKSFPSRHAFCAFMIATMFAIIMRSGIGMLALLMAVALGCIRVLEGVHFPRDIVAGALLGIVLGALCTLSSVG